MSSWINYFIEKDYVNIDLNNSKSLKLDTNNLLKKEIMTENKNENVKIKEEDNLIKKDFLTENKNENDKIKEEDTNDKINYKKQDYIEINNLKTNIEKNTKDIQTLKKKINTSNNYFCSIVGIGILIGFIRNY